MTNNITSSSQSAFNTPLTFPEINLNTNSSLLYDYAVLSKNLTIPFSVMADCLKILKDQDLVLAKTDFRQWLRTKFFKIMTNENELVRYLDQFYIAYKEDKKNPAISNEIFNIYKQLLKNLLILHSFLIPRKTIIKTTYMRFDPLVQTADFESFASFSDLLISSWDLAQQFRYLKLNAEKLYCNEMMDDFATYNYEIKKPDNINPFLTLKK